MIVATQVDDRQLHDMTSIALLMFKPERVNRMMADAGKTLTQRHLIQLGAERGKFYGNFAHGVHAESDANRADVVIPPAFGSQASTQRGNPLAAHFFGKTFTQADLFSINPKTGKKVENFAIPTDAAKGTRPGDYGDNLKPIFSKAGIIGLGLKPQGIPAGFTRKRQSGLKQAFIQAAKAGFRFPMLFVLVKGFLLKGGDGVGDKRVLPTPDEYAMAAMLSVKKSVQTGLENRGLA